MISGSLPGVRKGSATRGSPITEIKHATPPRPHALPSSPSSQRLRRVAPSPIRIVPYSKLKYSPESPTQLASDGIRGRQLEYQGRTTAEEGRGSNASGVSDVSDLTPSLLEAGEDVQMSRGEYVRAHYAREVMVDFRTDVFGPTSVSPPSPISVPSVNPVLERSSAFPSESRTSMHGSFATFGRSHSNQSNPTNRHRWETDTDAWSVSLYDRDDNRGDRSQIDIAEHRSNQSVPLLAPGYEGSPVTTDTELVTPDHDYTSLPEHESDDQETPTRPKTKAERPTHGLQLSLTGIVELDDWRCADAGVTPGPTSRRLATTSLEPLPPIPDLPAALPHLQVTPVIDVGSGKAGPGTVTAPSDLADFDRSTYIEIHVDQEGAPGWTTRMPFRRISRPHIWQEKEEDALKAAWKWNDPPPKPQPFQQTGCIVFGQPPRERDKWILHQEVLHSMPAIRQVTVNGNEEQDYMRKKVKLAIKEYGVYHASGHDAYGRIEWQFEYLVIHRTNKAGDILPNDRIVCPMHFYAAPSFFAAGRGINNGVAHLISKRAQTALVSQRMTPPRLGRPPKPPPPVLSPHDHKSTPRAERRIRNESSPAQIGRGEHRHLDVTGPPPTMNASFLSLASPNSAPRTASALSESEVTSGWAGVEAVQPPSATGMSSSSSGGKMTGFLQKMGAKSRSRPGSRGQGISPDSFDLPSPVFDPVRTMPNRPESVKSSKTRVRAASLLARMTRPFTPPAKTSDKTLAPTSKLSPMRSFSSLKTDSSSRFGTPNDSPPVPSLPPGLDTTRPRAGSRPLRPDPHPFATSLKPVGTTSDHHHSSVVSTVGPEGQAIRHFVVIPSKLRPASTILEPSVQETGGLAPPRRPILRKRPSTADPCINPSGRLVKQEML